MKTIALLLTSAFALSLCGQSLLAQDAPSKAAGEKPASAEKPKAPTQEELEAKFKTTLTKAIMSGRWCSLKDGVMGEEKEDKYTIQSVSKVKGDEWVIVSRIQYNKRDFDAPIPIKVKWAGDTAVIIVDNVAVPGGGVYSARVMVYENTYAGSWSGGKYGGLLNGTIAPQKE
ncbi:MAG TPA: hypothetical protein VGH19_13995 [Verrucomicrobiae bacterium]